MTAFSKYSPYFTLIARLWVGGVLAYAGFMKLLEPTANFQASLEQYPLIPPVLLPFLAKTIPWMEWIGGIFLMLGYLTQVCAVLFAFFSLTFIVVLSGLFWTGSAGKGCGCFGQSGFTLTVNQAYILDWVNLILSSFIAFRKKQVLSLDQLFR